MLTRVLVNPRDLIVHRALTSPFVRRKFQGVELVVLHNKQLLLKELKQRPLHDVCFDVNNVSLARLYVVLHDHVLPQVLVIISLRQAADCVTTIRDIKRVHCNCLLFSEGKLA